MTNGSFSSKNGSFSSKNGSFSSTNGSFLPLYKNKAESWGTPIADVRRIAEGLAPRRE
jgi:hypothetical protein